MEPGGAERSRGGSGGDQQQVAGEKTFRLLLGTGIEEEHPRRPIGEQAREAFDVEAGDGVADHHGRTTQSQSVEHVADPLSFAADGRNFGSRLAEPEARAIEADDGVVRLKMTRAVIPVEPIARQPTAQDDDGAVALGKNMQSALADLQDLARWFHVEQFRHARIRTTDAVSRGGRPASRGCCHP